MILWGHPRFLMRSGEKIYFFDCDQHYCGWDVAATYVQAAPPPLVFYRLVVDGRGPGTEAGQDVIVYAKG